MQIFPVVAMWGHLWGLDITATTAIPEAVLTGFCCKIGVNLTLYKSGIAAIISANFGSLLHPFSLAVSFLS
jgi:hypothetical protein